MDSHLQLIGNQAPSYHGLPPAIKLTGREVPPPPQVSSSGSLVWPQLVRRTTLGAVRHSKEDLGCSSIKLVYGSPIMVPGEFVDNRITPSSSNTCKSVWDHALAPIPTSRHGTAPAIVPKDLQPAKFMFVRRDAHHTFPQSPYEGPFKVIEHGPKSFKIEMGGKTESITVDRLKVAHLDAASPIQLGQPRPRGCPIVK